MILSVTLSTLRSVHLICVYLLKLFNCHRPLHNKMKDNVNVMVFLTQQVSLTGDDIKLLLSKMERMIMFGYNYEFVSFSTGK